MRRQLCGAASIVWRPRQCRPPAAAPRSHPRCINPATAANRPHFDVLVSTAWGAPSEIFKGFDPSKVSTHCELFLAASVLLPRGGVEWCRARDPAHRRGWARSRTAQPPWLQHSASFLLRPATAPALPQCSPASCRRRPAVLLELEGPHAAADHQPGPRRPDSAGGPVLARPLPAPRLCGCCPLLQRHPLHQGNPNKAVVAEGDGRRSGYSVGRRCVKGCEQGEGWRRLLQRDPRHRGTDWRVVGWGSRVMRTHP